MKLGAIETGGTKIVYGYADENGVLQESRVMTTLIPEKTIPQLLEYFRDLKVDALGIASFGPLNVHRNSKDYGRISVTEKIGWANFSLMEAFEELNCPVGIDTDVNGAALGEALFGAGRGLENVLYLTVGTGIGGGAVVDGKIVHGMMHPEMGHMYIARREDDTFEGNCSFHGACFEGLASGPAIEKRWGVEGKQLPVDHKAWDLEAYYIAEALFNYICILSPEKIILGGGVMHQKQLFPMIWNYVQKFNHGYVHSKRLEGRNIEDYIVSPGLGDHSGIMGAVALAKLALKSSKK